MLDIIEEIYNEQYRCEINTCNALIDIYDKMSFIQEESDTINNHYDIFFQEGEKWDLIKEDVKKQNEGKSNINKIIFTFIRFLRSTYKLVTGQLKKTKPISNEMVKKVTEGHKTKDGKRKQVKGNKKTAAKGITVVKVTAGAVGGIAVGAIIFGFAKKISNGRAEKEESDDARDIDPNKPSIVDSNDGTKVNISTNLKEQCNGLERLIKNFGSKLINAKLRKAAKKISMDEIETVNGFIVDFLNEKVDTKSYTVKDAKDDANLLLEKAEKFFKMITLIEDADKEDNLEGISEDWITAYRTLVNNVRQYVDKVKNSHQDINTLIEMYAAADTIDTDTPDTPVVDTPEADTHPVVDTPETGTPKSDTPVVDTPEAGTDTHTTPDHTAELLKATQASQSILSRSYKLDEIYKIQQNAEPLVLKKVISIDELLRWNYMAQRRNGTYRGNDDLNENELYVQLIYGVAYLYNVTHLTDKYGFYIGKNDNEWLEVRGRESIPQVFMPYGNENIHIKEDALKYFTISPGRLDLDLSGEGCDISSTERKLIVVFNKELYESDEKQKEINEKQTKEHERLEKKKEQATQPNSEFTMTIQEMFDHVERWQQKDPKYRVYDEGSHYAAYTSNPTAKYLLYSEGGVNYLVPNQISPFAMKQVSDEVYDHDPQLTFVDYGNTITLAVVDDDGHVFKKGSIK